MSRLSATATEIGFAAAWTGVRRLPEGATYAAFRGIADRMWRRRGPSVEQLEANLRRVVPGADAQALRELSREGLRSYFRYWCDSFRIQGWSRTRIVESFTCYGREHLDAGLAGGRGVVLALPHSGNWDHAGAWAALDVAPLTTVAERLRPEGLYRRFVEYRASLGIEILPLGGADTFRTLIRRLGENRLVPLLADRDISRTGVAVEFFGESARMPPGPAILAHMTGAPLLPATLHYTERGAAAVIHPPVVIPAGGTKEERIAAMTQGAADVLAGGIRQHPADWHMLQPLWSADVRPREGRE
jgi:KDO2-lipid IV(A) lauroyltransferase